MFPLLEGPQQSVPTAVTLATEEPAAEAMTGTRVFPDTAAPDASVARAARKLGSVAGSSSEICCERRAFRYYNSSWPKRGSNSNSSSSSDSGGNGSSSSSNDAISNYGPWWDTTCVVALLRPFDPGKGCQRDARRGKAVLGVDHLLIAGKHDRAEGQFLVLFGLCQEKLENRVLETALFSLFRTRANHEGGKY